MNIYLFKTPECVFVISGIIILCLMLKQSTNLYLEMLVQFKNIEWKRETRRNSEKALTVRNSDQYFRTDRSIFIDCSLSRIHAINW